MLAKPPVEAIQSVDLICLEILTGAVSGAFASFIYQKNLNLLNIRLERQVTARKKTELEISKHRDELEDLVQRRIEKLEEANRELIMLHLIRWASERRLLR